LSLKNAIPKLLRFNLVLTLDFAFANSGASTHTNYLINFLKNDEKGVRPHFSGSPQVYRPSGSADQPYGHCCIVLEAH